MHMNKIFAATAFAALGLISTCALAQHDRHDDRDDRGRYGMQHERGDDRRGPDDRDMRRDNDRRGFEHRERFHRGDRLPPEFRSRQYVVEDWRHYRLPPPPRGHHWVQVGSEYALVAIPTGVVVNVVVMP
ncbi:hypothetical protein E4K72_01915 [Oxalobacteraceae bacterium OM1]|nr:hypothetical protein E4K72_01915 [Oxalobacteraceae bacterium OM1]